MSKVLTEYVFESAAQVVFEDTVILRPATLHCPVGPVVALTPNVGAPGAAVTGRDGATVTLYGSYVLEVEEILLSASRLKRVCTYDPQMSIASERTSAKAYENVVGFESVKFRVSKVQKVQSSDVGNVRSPPVLLYPAITGPQYSLFVES